METLNETSRADVALEYAKDNILLPGNSERSNIPNVIVMITHGKTDLGKLKKVFPIPYCFR